jgi:polyisoprenoid-binding protein YceI
VIDEILRGSPFTVVGKTDQVAGQISVDPDNPRSARVGTIQINARTFKTDDNLRDRAIQSFVLQTNRYEFVTFAPETLRGLPERGRVGETYTFQIDGKLTIRNVTRDATFDATLTPESESRLKGQATTTIRRAEYQISVPTSNFVSGIADTVRLELEFVATSA